MNWLPDFFIYAGTVVKPYLCYCNILTSFIGPMWIFGPLVYDQEFHMRAAINPQMCWNVHHLFLTPSHPLVGEHFDSGHVMQKPIQFLLHTLQQARGFNLTWFAGNSIQTVSATVNHADTNTNVPYVGITIVPLHASKVGQELGEVETVVDE